MSIDFTQHPSSYRDPSGFIFEKEGQLYRQVNLSFKDHFDFFVTSGCYSHLVKNKLLIPHEIVAQNYTGDNNYYRTLRPTKINFISYPYEWSFDMLKDAALLTLKLVKECIPFGIILKDATPYNVQWHNGRFIFIDTLSFEKYDETKPWVAYRQFCECFLGPLLLMHYQKQDLHQLLLAYPDGFPLTIVKSMLPVKSRFSLYTYLHIHLHATVSEKNKGEENKQLKNFSKNKLLNIVNSLESLITKTKTPPDSSNWHDYYSEASQRDNYLVEKKGLVTQWIAELKPVLKNVIDFGANEGEFSQITANLELQTIATDAAADCINNLYTKIRKSGETRIQPLIIELANPSPSNGALSSERISFAGRASADLGLALALLHHLVIGKNMTFKMVAEFFSTACEYLIIEFVPKTDEKVEVLLSQKSTSYNNYSEAEFLLSFEQKFNVRKRQAIGTANRVLFLMQKK